jgi:rhodanese-related sulfurtransferase
MLFDTMRSLSFVALTIVVSCSGAGSEAVRDYVDVGYDEAVRMLDGEKAAVVFDVRTPGEFNNEFGHLPGARLLPMQVVRDSLDRFRQLDDRNILLVCRSGRRSGLVARELVKAGINKVYNLEGGLINWSQNGGRIEREFGR